MRGILESQGSSPGEGLRPLRTDERPVIEGRPDKQGYVALSVLLAYNIKLLVNVGGDQQWMMMEKEGKKERERTSRSGKDVPYPFYLFFSPHFCRVFASVFKTSFSTSSYDRKKGPKESPRNERTLCSIVISPDLSIYISSYILLYSKP